MARSIKLPDAGSTYLNLHKISQGGHGKTTAPLALTALNGVPADKIGQANEPIVLRADGTLDPAYLEGLSFTDAGIDGDTTIQTGETKEYFITTYDSFDTYTVSGILGEAVIDRNVIRYTAGTETGIGGFMLNGRLILVSIKDSAVVRPVIESPVNHSTVNQASFAITVSEFAVMGAQDTHVSSDWELSTDVSFRTLVSSSYDDNIHLTTWTVENMKELSRHYLRTRQRGVLNGVSQWSPVVSVTTGANGQLDEWGKIYADDAATGDVFGSSVTLSADGTIALIGAYAKYNNGINSGCVYVFTRSGSVWTQQQKLLPSTLQNNLLFGWGVAINADATIALIGAVGDNTKANYAGSVYVFTRSGSVWTQQQKLAASIFAPWGYFGSSITLNADASIALIGSHGVMNGSLSGAIYVFTRSGSIWTQQQILYSTNDTDHEYFGISSAVNTDATIALIGAFYNNTKAIGSGCVYVFTRTGSVWTQQQKITANDGVEYANFGVSVALNADATMALIGARGDDDKGSSSGSVYVFTRVGIVWTQQRKILASDGAANEQFGYSTALSADATIALIGALADSDRDYNAGCVYFYQ